MMNLARTTRACALLAALAATSACAGEIREHPALPSAPTGPPIFGEPEPGPRAPTLADVDGEGATAYLGRIAPILVGRTHTPAARATLERGGEAIPGVLDAWGDEPALARSARRMIETALAASGGVDDDGIDHGMPGRVVETVVRERRPWAEILTSETCYDASGAPIACDTGAPYTAGVLTTRAFLAARRGRFNLTRAGTMTSVFLCRTYPMPVEIEPHIPRETLRPMFRALSAEEQTDPEAAMSGLANGFHCYACHGQFGAHAQLFVRFDVLGRWHADATGEQAPEGMPGESFGGLMASHLVEPYAADERSQMLGEPVENLAGAARVLTEHPRFWSCSSRRVLELALDLDSSRGVDEALLQDVAATVRAGAASPSFQELLVATLAHPRVAAAAARQIREGEM